MSSAEHCGPLLGIVLNKRTSTQDRDRFVIMTSFIINAQASRAAVPELWRQDRECAFCQIIYRAAHAYRIYEDNLLIAFLGK